MDIVFLIKRYGLTLVGVIIGAFAGYLYYKNVGCVNGTCAITANRYVSTIYGAVMGGLIFSNFR